MQNGPREHSVILLTFIKLPFVFKTFVLSFFEGLLKTGFTVFLFYLLNSIDKRRKEVMDRRQKVKDQAAERHNALLGSQAFQEFKRDAAEVR